MSSKASTAGITLNTRHRALADTVELVSSMRFAITMFVMIAVAQPAHVFVKAMWFSISETWNAIVG